MEQELLAGSYHLDARSRVGAMHSPMMNTSPGGGSFSGTTIRTPSIP